MEEGDLLKAHKGKLELAMAKACISTAALAKRANMPRATLNGVISGRNVRPATLGKVARALGVDVTELMEAKE